MEKQKNIPQLRFPEYHGVWKRKKIKDLVEIKYGKDQKQIASIDGKYPIMGTGGEMGRTNVFLYDKPSVMIGRKGTIDKPRFMDTPFWTVDTLFYTEVFDNTDPKWLYYKFETISWYLYNEASGVPSLSSSTIYSIPIKTPSLPEQQKIASFFTAIDQKISQLKRKKTLLEQYKKGVMQKIFSQQIRFRYDNGQEFPKWEKRKLGDVGKTYNGLTGKTKEDFGQGKPYIQYKQIFDDTRIDISRFDFVRIRDGEKQCRVKYGDVFFTTSSETPDEVGTSSVLLDEVSEVYLNSFCFGYRSSRDFLIPLFSRYLFRNEVLRKEINKLAQGSTRYNISKNELMKTVIELPSIPEQTKIANFLSAIDDKIINTMKQIEKAEVWKKGLMQQMFV